MSITAAELLEFAGKLHGQEVLDEAVHRTVIGKAYYAAYHDSVCWHMALSSPGSLTVNGSNGIHSQLFQRLSNPTESTVRVASKKRGYALRALHEKRVSADYKLDETVSQSNASQALADAKLIISLN